MKKKMRRRKRNKNGEDKQWKTVKKKNVGYEGTNKKVRQLKTK